MDTRARGVSHRRNFDERQILPTMDVAGHFVIKSRERRGYHRVDLILIDEATDRTIDRIMFPLVVSRVPVRSGGMVSWLPPSRPAQ